MEIEPAFPSSKPVSLSLSLSLFDIRHDDYAISVEVSAALVGGKAKFVLGDAV
jgi:hypothetical protein